MRNADVLHLDHANFSDLQKNLSLCRSVLDFENLLRRINTNLHSGQLEPKEQQALAKLRQQAYDKKRKQKIQTPPPSDLICLARSDTRSDTRSEQKISPEERLNVNIVPTSDLLTKTRTFSDGFLIAINKIDGEEFAKQLPQFLATLSMLLVAVYFLWHQSMEVYQGAEFTNPMTAAAGGLAMIIGFSAYFAHARTLLAFMACIYAGSFETYLMISGTMHDEYSQDTIQISSTPELILLQTKAETALAKYQKYQARHSDPKSDVYQNGWFEKTHVTPSLTQSEAAFAAVTQKKSELLGEQGNHSGPQWIKIFYRLGLVLLCMIFAHRFFLMNPFRGNFLNQKAGK